MFEIFKNVINNKQFDLRDMLYKIEESYIKSDITKDDKEKLEELARNNANAVNSYEDIQKRIDDLTKGLESLTRTVEANAQGTSALKDAIIQLGGVIETPSEGGDEEEQPIDEYPEYVQPTGAHDAYYIGDKITFEGDKYECLLDGCVWNPVEYPNGWKKILPEELENTIETTEEINE